MPGKPVAMDPRAELREIFVLLEVVVAEIISSNCKDGRIPERHCVVIFCFFERSKSNFGLHIIVQQVCIPQAILGTDVLCQAKSGLGKTAVFVLTTLQQVEPVPGECAVLVMCHTRELAYQIKNEYARFAKYMPEVKTGVFYGGTPMQKDIETLSNKDTHPHIIVATPGRLNALVCKHLSPFFSSRYKSPNIRLLLQHGESPEEMSQALGDLLDGQC